MSIDKQRIAAVAAVEAPGFKYISGRGWLPPLNSERGTVGGILPDFTSEADAEGGARNALTHVDDREAEEIEEHRTEARQQD